MKWVLVMILIGTLLLVTGLSLLGQALLSSTTTGMQASQALRRINQLDATQYQSAQEYTLWSPATCSAASITEVLDAYGQHLRITDILAVENGLHGISPQLGMLFPEVIAQTVAHFGFTDTVLHHPPLTQLITLGNAGTPVIVNFPPAPGPWSEGHMLVVLGGTSNTVRVADSSALNLQTIATPQFLAWWGGTADLVTPQQHSAPATLTNPYAREAWQIALAYHLNPGYFVAQIRQESNFNPMAISPAGAIGIAQFLPGTAACLARDAQQQCVSIDPRNPEQAMAGAAYLMEKSWMGYLAQTPQDPLEAYRKALAAYNGGSALVQQALSRCQAQWLHCLPTETQHYIIAILTGGN